MNTVENSTETKNVTQAHPVKFVLNILFGLIVSVAHLAILGLATFFAVLVEGRGTSDSWKMMISVPFVTHLLVLVAGIRLLYRGRMNNDYSQILLGRVVLSVSVLILPFFYILFLE
jgi:hypothetical protein